MDNPSTITPNVEFQPPASVTPTLQPSSDARFSSGMDRSPRSVGELSPKRSEGRSAKRTSFANLQADEKARVSTSPVNNSGFGWVAEDFKGPSRERFAPGNSSNGTLFGDKRMSPTPKRMPSPAVYHIPIGALSTVNGESNAYDVVVEIHTTVQAAEPDPTAMDGVAMLGGTPSEGGASSWSARPVSHTSNALMPSFVVPASVRKPWYEYPGLDPTSIVSIRSRLEECIAMAKAMAARGEYTEALEMLVEIQMSFESGRSDFLALLEERKIWVQRVGQSIQEVTAAWTHSLEEEKREPGTGAGGATQSILHLSGSRPKKGDEGDTNLAGTRSSSRGRGRGPDSGRSHSWSRSGGSGRGSRRNRRSLGDSGRRDTLTGGSPRKGIPIPRDPLVMQPVSMNSSLIGELSSADDDQILGEERNEPFLKQGGCDDEDEKHRVKHPLKHDEETNSTGSPSMDELFNWVPRKKEDNEKDEETDQAEHSEKENEARSSTNAEEEIPAGEQEVTKKEEEKVEVQEEEKVAVPLEASPPSESSPTEAVTEANATGPKEEVGGEEAEGEESQAPPHTEAWGGGDVEEGEKEYDSDGRPSLPEDETTLGEVKEASLSANVRKKEAVEGLSHPGVEEGTHEQGEDEDEEIIRQMVEDDLKRKANEDQQNLLPTMTHPTYGKAAPGTTALPNTGDAAEGEEVSKSEAKGEEQETATTMGNAETVPEAPSSVAGYPSLETEGGDGAPVRSLSHPPRPPSGPSQRSSSRSSLTPRGVSPVMYHQPVVWGEGGVKTPPAPAMVDDMTAREVLLHNGPARPHVTPLQTPKRESTINSSASEVTGTGTAGTEEGREREEEEGQETALGHSKSNKGSEAEVVVVKHERYDVLRHSSPHMSCPGTGVEGSLEYELEMGSTEVVTGTVVELCEDGEMTPEILESDGTSQREYCHPAYTHESSQQETTWTDTTPRAPEGASEEGLDVLEIRQDETHSEERQDGNEAVNDDREDEGGFLSNAEEEKRPQTALSHLKRVGGGHQGFYAYPYSFPTSAGPYSASYRPISGGCTVYANRKTPKVESDEVVFKRRSDLFRDRAWLHSNGDKLLPPKDWLRARRAARKSEEEGAPRALKAPELRRTTSVEEKILAEIFQEKKVPRTFLLVPSKPKKAASQPGTTPSNDQKTSLQVKRIRHPVSREVPNLRINAEGQENPNPDPSGKSPHYSSVSAPNSGAAALTKVSPVQTAVYGKTIDDSVLFLRVVDGVADCSSEL